MRRAEGLTLIEVLIALAILSIAFLAVVMSYNDSLRSTRYLIQKTYANWVGLDILARAQIGLVTAPFAPQEFKGETTAFKQNWQWIISQTATDDPHTFLITTKVQEASGQTLISLQGYRSQWS